jgi:putative ABC transport system permease protein
VKFLPLILANFRRKKIRTTLTLGSFAVALFLFGLLVTIHGAFYAGVDVAGADRLVVINRTSIIQPLPISYRDRLARIPGISGVTYANWFGGIYQDEKNFFVQFAVDTDQYRTMFPEFVLSDAEWSAFLKDREGAIVGAGTAKRFGWKVGDRIPIRGTIFPGTWEFDIRGIYHGKRPSDDETQFWFQRAYLEERGPQWIKGLVGWYTVRISNPDQAASIIAKIDAEFRNSSHETRTDTEKGFAASFAKQMGNIELLILIIGGVVFFTLLLVTGNTMAISVRERIGELAVLKTVGFTDGAVLGLVLFESLFVAAVGGGAGLAAAKLLTLAGDPTGGLLPIFFLPGGWVAGGFVLTLAVGLVAGLLPAVAAMRLKVVDALRRV